MVLRKTTINGKKDYPHRSIGIPQRWQVCLPCQRNSLEGTLRFVLLAEQESYANEQCNGTDDRRQRNAMCFFSCDF